MRKYTACRSCGKIIQSHFKFCPHCGVQRIRSYEFRSITNPSLLHLMRLQRRLESLETDLDSLCSS